MLASEINKRLRQDGCSPPFFSLEFYPPLKEENVDDFIDTLLHLKQANPLFVDITWSRRNDPGNLSRRNSSTTIALRTKQLFGAGQTMLHICCNGYTKAETMAHLEMALANGIRNIMALRGDDLPEMEAQNGGNGEEVRTKYYAIDLVKWTRDLSREVEEYSEVSIGVAGHIHPPDKAISYDQCLAHLKEKVDAGAHFITTQFFLDVRQLEKFQDDCQHLGIYAPILPGILLFKSAASLRKIAGMANVPIPEEITRILDANKGDPAAVQNFSVQLAFDMCRHILASGRSKGVHLFTLNQRDMCSKLLKRLGFWPTLASEPSLNGEGNMLLAKKNGIKTTMAANGTTKRAVEIGSENGEKKAERTAKCTLMKQNGHKGEGRCHENCRESADVKFA